MTPRAADPTVPAGTDGAQPMERTLAEMARKALSRGDMAMVARAAAALIERDPHAAEGPFLLGLAQAAAGRVSAGIDHLRAAIALDPRGEYHAQLARLLLLVRRDADAAAALAATIGHPPDDGLSHDTIGCAFARLGDHHAALPHFEIATRLAPDHREFLYNHAATLSYLGRTDAAEAALERLIALDPLNARAHHLLAGLRRQTPARNHVDRLRDGSARARDGSDKLLFGYALAKELDDLGEARQGFAILDEANRRHRRSLAYSFAGDAAVFDAIEARWTQPPAARGGETSAPAAPIFVIGMPRTGTTLVDRILSSHPRVESLGELQAMPLAVKAASATRTRTVLDPETIIAAARADFPALGEDYLRRAAPYRRTARPRFVDKFPGNFQYVGPIARALPGAAIVCLRRDPLDTVLGNYRNLFAIGSRYYDYSYDLEDIAAYFVRFDRLMARWHAAFPGRVLNLRYEDLVADQEGQTRRLLTHCGLTWADACLEFHTNAAPVSTPSAAQVRRPLYRDALARWRAHVDALAPARSVLEAAGIGVE